MIDRLRRVIARLYSREGFRGPVVTLLSGSVFTLAVAYLAQLVLRRLFTREEFGIAEYFVSMLGVLVTFSSLRYEDALMLPEDEDEAASVFWLASVLTALTVVLLAVAAVWSEPITRMLRVEKLSPWLWLAPPTLLLMRMTKLSEYWLARRKEFRAITAGDVANKLTMVTSRIAAGFWTSLGAGGLIGGFAAGYATSSALYGWRLIYRGRSLRHFDLRDMWRMAGRYRRFAFFATPSSLLNTVVARLPILLLPFYFDLSVVGDFGLAYMVLAVPLGLVGSAVAHVFFVHAAEAHRAGTLAELSRTVHARLVMIGLFPALALMIVAPDLFAFFFTEEWRLAGEQEQIVALWLFLAAVASPLTRLFDVLERQRTELWVSLAMFAAQTAALIAGGTTGDLYLTLLLITLAGGAGRLLHIATMLHLAGVRPREMIAPYLRFAAYAAPFLALLAAVNTTDVTWLTTLMLAAAGAGYGALVVWKEQLTV